MNEADSGIIEIVSDSVQRTIELGRELARVLEPDDVVALVGPLGAGKTQLVRGIAEGLGVDPRQIASPTFVLMCEYAGRVPVVHIDAYRMTGFTDLESIGFSAELTEGSVTLIEWADRIAAYLPADHLHIELRHRDDSERELRITPFGAWRERMAALRKSLLESNVQHNCPACGQPVARSADTFPFCCGRCRLVDLNRWFGGEYRVSRQLTEQDDLTRLSEDDDDAQPPL